jgi:tetratricopeptide (TPR) repeat protein
MTRALKKAQGSIPRRADDVATLVGRLRLALCLCDLDAAARWGEALLDKTLRYDDLNALYRPVLFDTDSLVVRSAPRRFGLRVMTAFERYLDTHPDSPWASYYYRIFGAKLRCGLNWTRDEACLRTLKALPLARYGWMRYHIGLDSLMKRDFAGAVEQFSLGVTHSVGRDWRSRCHIGEALLCQGDAPAALSSFDETLKDDPGANRPLIQAWKAEVLLWAGDYRGALAVSQEALQKNAAGLAFCWKGGALVKLGRPLLALEPLGLAIAVWPADIEARVWRSEALYRLGRPREALLEAQTAKKIDRGSNFYCSVAAGLARFALGDVKGMRRELSELPSAVINHVARQTGFDSSGSADAAAKTLEAVLSLSQGVRRGAYETAAWLSSSKMLSRGH